MSDIKIDILPTEALNKLFGPSCNAIGQTAGAIFNFTFSPLIKYNITKQKELDDLANGVAEKASKIPEKNLDDSKMDQVLKIIESSRYSISNENIRNMYKNLISNCLDDRKNNCINNYFATVISNLSPESASLLETLYKNHLTLDVFPVITISIIHKDDGASIYSTGDMAISSDYINIPIKVENYSSVLNLLQSLGIIEIDFSSWLSSKIWQKIYTKIYKNSISKYNLDESNTKYQKGIVKITDLGKSFMKSVSD